MKLKDRITLLEQRLDDARPPAPALFYWKQKETITEAKEAYKQRYGYELPPDGHIIQFVACDMSRAGNGREISKEEFQSLSEVHQ
ncbi:hypothetical protein [Nitrosomonas sp.]|uniref:hypothetical protein n=1 Tax=Nitrosomonas sp. TaxID=42353 RepID=UPI00262D644D|nr:hypothetical protein [Nitrosomonas sp.]MCW5602734.1 hypothetical protein [Nitrosomonas sp.]